MSLFKCYIEEEIERTKDDKCASCKKSSKECEDCTCDDEYIGRVFWHLENCTCHLMYFYSFHQLEQDAHIRTWLETQNLLRVSWDNKFGVLYEFLGNFMDSFLNENVRNYLNYYKKED